MRRPGGERIEAERKGSLKGDCQGIAEDWGYGHREVRIMVTVAGLSAAGAA